MADSCEHLTSAYILLQNKYFEHKNMSTSPDHTLSTEESVLPFTDKNVRLVDTISFVSDTTQDVRGRTQIVDPSIKIPDADASEAPSDVESIGYQHAKQVGEEVVTMLIKRIKSVIELAHYLCENPTNFQDREVATMVLNDIRDALSRLRHQYDQKLNVVKEHAISRIASHAEKTGVVRGAINDRHRQLNRIADTLESASRKVTSHLNGMNRVYDGPGGGVQGVVTDFVNKFGPPQEYVQKQLEYINKTSNKIQDLENKSHGLKNVLHEDEFRKLQERVEKLF